MTTRCRLIPLGPRSGTAPNTQQRTPTISRPCGTTPTVALVIYSTLTMFSSMTRMLLTGSRSGRDRLVSGSRRIDVTAWIQEHRTMKQTKRELRAENRELRAAMGWDEDYSEV